MNCELKSIMCNTETGNLFSQLDTNTFHVIIQKWKGKASFG